MPQLPAGYSLDPAPPAGYKLDGPPSPETAKPEDRGFFRGLWDSVNPIAAVKAITEPTGNKYVDMIPGATVATNLVRGAVTGAMDQAGKAKDSFQKGDYYGAFGHGLAAALPVLGPAAADAGDMIGDGRTGEGLGRAAGLLGAVVAPEVVPKALSGARDALAKTAIPDALRNSAETQYARVLNPTTKGNKIRTAQVVPQLIDRGVMAGSLKGLDARAAAEAERASSALEATYDRLPDNASIPVQPILDRLAGEKQQFTALAADGTQTPMGPVAEQGVAHLDGLSAAISKFARPDEAGNAVLPVAIARQLRQGYDEVSRQAGRFNGTPLADQSQGAAHGMAADAIRGGIADNFPDVADANKELNLWLNTKQVTGDSLLRKQGQSPSLASQLMRSSGTVGGFMTGGIHGAVIGKVAMGALENAVASPAWRTVSSVWKDRLADAIAKGDRGPAEFAVQKIAQQIQAAPPPPAIAPPAQAALEQPSLFDAPSAAAAPAMEATASAPAAPVSVPPLPGSIRDMSPHDVEADPARFQFKRDTGGKSGTGDELKSVQNYDPELGGVLSVWRDPADGKTYVVNGHHRLELAQRANAPVVSARYLDAADAGQARTKGALINIAEGRGTAIDAAKVFREGGITPEELNAKGISLRGPIARDGQNLANLAPGIFDHVVSGELPVQKASLIGELLPNHADQQSALDLLGRAEKNGKTITNDAFRELVGFVKDGPKKMGAVDQNMGLFGDAEPEEESAAVEMAGLSDYVRKRLMSEKKLFGTVADVGKSKVLEDAGNTLAGDKNAEMATGATRDMAVYDKLKTSAGPINDALRNAAQSLGKRGAPANEIRDHAYQRIRAAINQTLSGK